MILKRTKKAFTLLEVMIALALLALAGGAIGWKMHKAVAKKQFQSQVERLKERFEITQKLAIAMQADWRGFLRKNGDGWVFETVCEEDAARKFSPLRLESVNIHFEGRQVDVLEIDFFASGKVFPLGCLCLFKGDEKTKWQVSDFFEKNQGKNLGPIHPNEKN